MANFRELGLPPGGAFFSPGNDEPDINHSVIQLPNGIMIPVGALAPAAQAMISSARMSDSSLDREKARQDRARGGEAPGKDLGQRVIEGISSFGDSIGEYLMKPGGGRVPALNFNPAAFEGAMPDQTVVDPAVIDQMGRGGAIAPQAIPAAVADQNAPPSVPTDISPGAPGNQIDPAFAPFLDPSGRLAIEPQQLDPNGAPLEAVPADTPAGPLSSTRAANLTGSFPLAPRHTPVQNSPARAKEVESGVPARVVAYKAAKASQPQEAAPAAAAQPQAAAPQGQRRITPAEQFKQVMAIINGTPADKAKLEQEQQDDRNMGLLAAGLGTIASASRPGATAFGSMAEGALGGLNMYRGERRQRTATEQARQKTRADTGKLYSDMLTKESELQQRADDNKLRVEERAEAARQANELRLQIAEMQRQTSLDVANTNAESRRDTANIVAASRTDAATGNKDTAMIKDMNHLVSKGVAKDDKDAFRLVNLAKSNPTEAAKDILIGLMKAEEMSVKKTPREELVKQAKKIVADLSGDDAAPSTQAVPKPVGRYNPATGKIEPVQ